MPCKRRRRVASRFFFLDLGFYLISNLPTPFFGKITPQGPPLEIPRWANRGGGGETEVVKTPGSSSIIQVILTFISKLIVGGLGESS